MLELGCGDGANLLSMAQTLPGATFVGIDAAAPAIERGTAMARAAELANVSLAAGDIEQLPADLGSFDYIVAHGVYSWIPPRARESLLSACRRHLTSQGIAFVSYNAYPGSYLREMARDILRYHLREIEDPTARLAGAHELMRTIVDIDEPSPFGRALREQMQRTLGYSDALLVHDDLAEISTPFYFHQFVEHAEAHGLRFVSEASVADSQMRDVPDSAARLMASLPDDVIVREQYLDFFRNRMFRQTLLCHAEAAVHRALDDGPLAAWWLSSAARRGAGDSGVDDAAEPEGPEAGTVGHADAPESETFVGNSGVVMTSAEPIVRAAMGVLGDAWPGARAFASLVEQACERGAIAPGQGAAERLRAVMLQAYIAGIIQLQSAAPPLAPEAGERPRASPLARAQHAAGAPLVATLRHTNAALVDELERALLPLLDGRHDAAALAAALERPRSEVDAALQRLADSGLLCAGG